MVSPARGSWEQCSTSGCLNRITTKTGKCGIHKPMCAIDDCNNYLAYDNNTGYCKPHRYLDPTVRKSVIQYGKIWKRQNKDKINEDRRKQHAINPNQNKRYVQNRRAKINSVLIDEIDLTSIWRRDAGLCFLCSLPADKNNWWLEHVLPISRGGTHSYDNVAVSHPECNNTKKSKTLEEYDRWLLVSGDTDA